MLHSIVRSRLLWLPLGAGALGALAAILINDRFLNKYYAVALIDPFIPPQPTLPNTEKPRSQMTRAEPPRSDATRADTARSDALRADANRADVARSEAARADAAMFRRLQPRLFDGPRFKLFAEHVKVPDEMFDLIGSGASQRLRVDYNFGVSRADLRDLPEAVARDYSLQILKDGIGSGAIVSCTDHSERRAFETGTIFAAYVADSALRMIIEEQWLQWSMAATTALPVAHAETLEVSRDLQSVERRIAGLMLLRDKAHSASLGVVGSDPSLQIQTTDSRFLSHAQKLTALETDKIDLQERRHQLKLQTERLQIQLQINERTQSLITPKTPAKAMLTALLHAFEVEKANILSQTGADQTNALAALTDVELFFTMTRHRFLQGRAAEVFLKPDGPKWIAAATMGFAGGLLLSFFVGLIAHRSRLLDRAWWLTNVFGTKVPNARASAEVP